jgi:hypothetical protein
MLKRRGQPGATALLRNEANFDERGFLRFEANSDLGTEKRTQPVSWRI